MAPHYQDFDFKLASEAKIQPVFLKVQAGKTLSYHGHALVTLYVQFLYSDRSKFDRWVHADKLCSILKVVNFDGWSWQSFVSTCDVFNCLFLLDVQKWNTAAIKSILLFMASLFIGFFGWEMRRSSKSEIRFRMASFSFFTWLEKSEAIRTGLTWYLSGAASRMVSLSNDCIWCLFFISNLMRSSVVIMRLFSLCMVVRFETMIWPSIRFDQA